MLYHFLVDRVIFRDKKSQVREKTFKLSNYRGALVRYRRLDTHRQVEANGCTDALLAGQLDGTPL